MSRFGRVVEAQHPGTTPDNAVRRRSCSTRQAGTTNPPGRHPAEDVARSPRPERDASRTAGQLEHRSLVRLRTLTHPKKSLFLGLTALAAVAVVAVPASAAGTPPRDDTPAAVQTGPRPVDHDAQFYATVARGAAHLAHGKVSSKTLKAQIADIENSTDASPATVRAMTAELRTTTAHVAAKVVKYEKKKAREEAERKAAERAAAEKARQEAAEQAAAEQQAAQEQSDDSGSDAAIPASTGEVSSAGDNSPSAARAYARSAMASRYGWGDDQFSCLNSLWNRESGWRVYAANPSGAYGIPQAVPGSKMGSGWQSSATVQVNWGLGYIKARYGTPCGAWAQSQAAGWY